MDDVEIPDDQRKAAGALRELAQQLWHWGDADWMEEASVGEIYGEIADRMLAEQVAIWREHQPPLNPAEADEVARHVAFWTEQGR